MKSIKLWLFTWLVCFLAASLPVLAQSPSPAPSPSPTPATITKEQTIYVPFEKLEQVFENQGRGVFLPYREFLEMWNKLNLPEIVRKTEPPVSGVVASANYSGKVEGDAAIIAAKLSLEALKENWSSLDLGARDLHIADLKSNATLHAREGGGYDVVFPNKGRYDLAMTIYGKIVRETGRSSLKLNLPRTAASQFELVIPEKGLDFNITPASAFTAIEQPDGSTKLAVYFGASQEVNISWQKRAGDTALAPLLFAETSADVKISAGAVRTTFDVQYRILRAGVNAFELFVPTEQQVLAVDGQNLRDWTLDRTETSQRLIVNLHAPARENYALRISLETGVASLPARVPLPNVEVRNVERQSGVVTISTDPELVVEAADLSGLTQQSAVSERGKPLVGQYRYLRLPFGGNLAISQAQPLVEVSSETLASVEPETLSLWAKFNYTVKKSGIFSTRIALPVGFERAEAKGDQVESATVQKVGDKNVLDVKFSARRTGDFSFEVTSDAPRKAADEPLTVPVFTPQNVQRHEAKVGVAIHVSLKANTTDMGDMRQEDIRNIGVQPQPKNAPPQQSAQPPQQQAQQVFQTPKAGHTPLTLGFRYRGEARPARVAFELRKPRVSVEVLALVEAREAIIRNTWWLNYNVEYAGVSEVSIAVPKDIADDLQIEGANIKERTKSEQKDDKGQPTGSIVWTVSFQDKVLGSHQLKLSLETPQTQLKQGATASLGIHEIKPFNVFREIGQVAVVKDGNIEITKTDAKGLELIDPKELSAELQQREGIFLAYKYAAHPIALRLDLSKNFYLEVPSALVTYAVLTSVVAENRAETTEVIYWVRNNSQQFFSIQLPAGGKLLSDAFVNGEPQQPSRRPDKNEMLVRLPVQQSVNEAFPIRFVYEVPSPRADSRLGLRGTLAIAPPVVASAEVMQTKWTLYLPGGWRYVKFGGAMQEPSARRGWDRFRRAVDGFVPKLGEQPSVPRERPDAWNEPPPLPPAKSAGFDFQVPKEGSAVTLRRLDASAAIDVHFRSKGYANTVEAILFFLAFFIGVRLTSQSRATRFAYAVFVGIGALIIAGAVAPRAAGMWTAIYLGVFFAVLVWLTRGFWLALRNWRTRAHERRREREATRQAAQTPTPPPSTPPPSPAI